MEFVEGDIYYDLFAKSSPDQIPDYMKQFTKLMVSLHKLDWKKIISEEAQVDVNNPYFAANTVINEMCWVVENFDKKAYLPTIEWLKNKKEHYPVNKYAFIHKDFHWLNIIVTENNYLFLIDWSTSNVSDIREEIAYTATIFNMVGHAELNPIFSKLYEELSGDSIGDIKFYEVITSLRLILFFTLPIGNTDLVEDQDLLMDRLQSQKKWLQKLYDYLIERTNIRIPEFEMLL